MVDGTTVEGTAEVTFLELADLFIDIAREIRVRSAQTTPVVPLTQTQSQIMRFVHLHPGCSASDIADGGGLQRANVSSALRELRTRGYLVSERDEADGRAIRITATAEADANIARLRRSWADLIETAWEHEGAGDIDSLSAVTATLSRIRSGLSAERATKAFSPDAPGFAATGADSSGQNSSRGKVEQ